MLTLLRRCWKAMLKSDAVDAMEPLRPIVRPDEERAAELKRRRDAITFRPTQGFIHRRFDERRGN